MKTLIVLSFLVLGLVQQGFADDLHSKKHHNLQPSTTPLTAQTLSGGQTTTVQSSPVVPSDPVVDQGNNTAQTPEPPVVVAFLILAVYVLGKGRKSAGLPDAV